MQKVTHITPTGKTYHLVTLKALREAGERHMDLRGADRDVTARGSQHSALVKEKHYKKSGCEEFQEQQKNTILHFNRICNCRFERGKL